MKHSPISRRDFIRRTALAAGSLMIVPRRVLGGPGYIPPSDELTKAVIGVGGMGRAHLQYPGSRLLAVCDVDSGHLQAALDISGAGSQGIQGFPRGPGPAGHRHRPYRHSPSLARPDLGRGGRGRERHLVREADDPDDRRRASRWSRPSRGTDASSESTPGSGSRMTFMTSARR